MKTYYYNIKDGSWDQMLMIEGEMRPVDNHIRIPLDWTTMIMPIKVFKAYINLILTPKVQTPKRINIWRNYYNYYRNEWNANGFVKCKVEGQDVIIESLNKHWECRTRIHI